MFSLFVLGSKYGISSAFNLCYLGNNFLFPVSILATSYGVCNIFARLITIGAPYFAELKPIEISQFTFVAFAVFAMLASLLIRKPLDKAIRQSNMFTPVPN